MVLPGVYLTPGVGDGLFKFGVAIFFAFLACAVLILVAGKEHPTLSLLLGGVWVISVPIFFFVEHVYFFRKHGDPDQYEQFKRLQDLAAKIWAAAIVILVAFGNHVLPGSK